MTLENDIDERINKKQYQLIPKSGKRPTNKELQLEHLIIGMIEGYRESKFLIKKAKEEIELISFEIENRKGDEKFRVVALEDLQIIFGFKEKVK